MNVKEVKRRNKKLIIKALSDCGAMSRKELAGRLALTPAALSKLSAEMIAEGWLEEEGELVEAGRSGRREIPLALRLDRIEALSVNAERDALTLSVVDLAGGLKRKKRFTPLPTLSETLRKAKAFLEEGKERVRAVGICAVGTPDGYGVWGEGRPAEPFEEAFGVSAKAENNVRAFAKAQLYYAKKPMESKSELFFKWGPGLGSAIVLDGSVRAGNDAGTAEIGHYVVDPEGKRCRCGRRGCLETVASVEAIEAVARARAEASKGGKIATCPEEILEEVLAEEVEQVALALANTATVLDARRVIFFGSAFERANVAESLGFALGRLSAGRCAAEISPLNAVRDHVGGAALALEALMERI